MADRRPVCAHGRPVVDASESLPNLVCYEDFISSGDSGFEWPVFDELSASSLFYTSGTTGNPKGVLYSHRSDVLHALTLGGACGFGFVAQDTILPMTPMFHANGAWGFTHAAPMVGAKLICLAPSWMPPALPS